MFALLSKESVFFFKILVSFLVQLELLLLKPFSKQLNNFKEKDLCRTATDYWYMSRATSSYPATFPLWLEAGGRGREIATHVRSPVPGTGEKLNSWQKLITCQSKRLISNNGIF